MNIDRILAGIRSSTTTEKQASAAAPAAASSAEKVASQDALVSALNDALSTQKTAGEKTVTPASPVGDVMKVAEEIAAAEKTAAVKEAELLGAAFADAAIARWSGWNKVAGEMLQNAPASEPSPEQLKEAAEYGYKLAQEEMEKAANDAYVQGYNDQVEMIHKTAQQEFLKAAALTEQLLRANQG